MSKTKSMTVERELIHLTALLLLAMSSGSIKSCGIIETRKTTCGLGRSLKLWSKASPNKREVVEVEEEEKLVVKFMGSKASGRSRRLFCHGWSVGLTCGRCLGQTSLLIISLTLFLVQQTWHDDVMERRVASSATQPPGEPPSHPEWLLFSDGTGSLQGGLRSRSQGCSSASAVDLWLVCGN